MDETPPEEYAEAEPIIIAPVEFDPVESDHVETDERWVWLLVAGLLSLLLECYGRLQDAQHRARVRTVSRLLGVLAVLGGGVILAQQRGEDVEEEADVDADTGTRTRAERPGSNCVLGASFRLLFVPPVLPPGQDKPPSYLFTQLRPGVRFQSNGTLFVQADDLQVGPYPGTLTFIYRRGPTGETEFARRTFRIESDADVERLKETDAEGKPKVEPQEYPKPDALDTEGRIIDQLRVEVTYVPDEIDEECPSIHDNITVVWEYNTSERYHSWWWMGATPNRVPGRVPVPRHRSRVIVDRNIVDETTGIPGKVNKATHTWVMFNVDDPFDCCGAADRPYTIIQFVRHMWQLGENRPRRDRWNLDGPESQADRHADGDEYDPTFTTDPAHGASTADEDNELVGVGPWDGTGGAAVTVEDFPGLLEADHETFRHRGGWFAWEFVTLLVCREDQGSATHYLEHGRVRAKSHFVIERQYPGRNQPPEVQWAPYEKGAPGDQVYYERCRDLGDLLVEMELLEAFENPRPHEIRLE